MVSFFLFTILPKLTVFVFCSNNENSFFLGKKIESQFFSASSPDTRITAIPPTPGAVDMAVIVDMVSVYVTILKIS